MSSPNGRDPSRIESLLGGVADSEKLYVLTGKEFNKIVDMFKIANITSTDSTVTIDDRGLAGTDISIADAMGKLRAEFLGLKSLQLVPSSDSSIRIAYGSIAGIVPSVFNPGDSPVYTVSASSGSKVYATINYSDTTGVISSVSINVGSSIPTSTTGTHYELIGSVGSSGGSLTTTNARYGPINVQICRNWFWAAAPFYAVNIS